MIRFLLILLLFSACSSIREDKSVSAHANGTIDESLFGNLAAGDTLVFSNIQLGNDTVIVDSISRTDFTGCSVANLSPQASSDLYTTYICSSQNRQNNKDIAHNIALKDHAPIAMVRIEKFADRPGQTNILIFGESFSINPAIRTLKKPSYLPGCRFSYNQIISADTIYLESSPFHIETLYWSDSTGPVGFETIGGYIWFRTK